MFDLYVDEERQRTNCDTKGALGIAMRNQAKKAFDNHFTNKTQRHTRVSILEWRPSER